MDIYTVKLSKKTNKDLKKIPKHVVVKLQAWIDDVGESGLREMRKIKGYHDEPVKGKRDGQRSIRLSIAYRAIYKINDADDVNHFIEIIGVNKHDYSSKS